MKISIIGYSGSGKSSTAETIGARLNIPVLYLDTVFWLKNWQERNRDNSAAIVRDFLDLNENWVIDGNYSRLYHNERMERADMIVFFNFNRFNCLWRAFRRWRKYKGKTRPSMTEGCDEKFDFEFISWILWQGRTKEKKKDYNNICNKYKNKTVVLKNQRQLDKFLENYKN